MNIFAASCNSYQLICYRRLLKERVQPKSSTLQLVAVNEQRAVLHRQIRKWQLVQTFYLPAVSELPASELTEDGEVVHAEDILLYLPSGCPSTMTIPQDLVAMEKRLRIAQAEDALTELRRLLRISCGLWQYKKTQVGPSQRAGTRAQSLISRFKNKIDRCADRYRAARRALVGLDPQGVGEWSKRFRELRAEHVRGPRRNEEDQSEGRRELSWIWMVRSASESSDPSTMGDQEFGESKSASLEKHPMLIVIRCVCGMGTIKSTSSPLG